MLEIDPKKETEKIVRLLKSTLKKTGLKKYIIGWSGGIDSTVCLYLLTKAVPARQIHLLHMPYFETQINDLQELIKTHSFLHDIQIHEISIRNTVDQVWGTVSMPTITGKSVALTEKIDRVRKGNIIARVRMIILFDFSKKTNGLVCGTENKTEQLLGYFTRYGDEASDIEPIRSLYKTEVFELAKYLGVPENFINRKPSANLWDGQTDEGEFGFTYKDADSVLSGNLKGVSQEIIRKIEERVKQNAFKHEVPYSL
ncbi:MAG: NAD(+) synthase [Patescibacteria group bacterium]